MAQGGPGRIDAEIAQHRVALGEGALQLVKRGWGLAQSSVDQSRK